MTTDVDEILETLRSLPSAKQLEVLQSLARSLSESLSPMVGASADFWSQRSIKELEAEQGVPVAGTLSGLAMPGWPANETADDFIAYVRSQRDADRGS
jgi:hypothetical protein